MAFDYAIAAARAFPDDASVLTLLMMNPISLDEGGSVFIPAGTPHAYIQGTGAEIMTNSDNVLRGGLTAKHIDVDALLHVVDFAPGSNDVLLPSGSDGTYIYPTSFEEFELWLLQPTDGDTLQLPRGDSGRICLVASGSFELTSDADPIGLTAGHAVFVAAEEAVVARGEGRLFVAATGV